MPLKELSSLGQRVRALVLQAVHYFAVVAEPKQHTTHFFSSAMLHPHCQQNSADPKS